MFPVRVGAWRTCCHYEFTCAHSATEVQAVQGGRWRRLAPGHLWKPLDTFSPGARIPFSGASASVRSNAWCGWRARDARRKALLGGFLAAQCRHKPKVHAAMDPDIKEWLLSHRSEKVGAKNVEALSGFFADAAHKGLSAPAANSRKARRERTHRLILLGAWVLARRKRVKELGDLVGAELARFLDQGNRADRHKALLKDVLAKPRGNRGAGGSAPK